MDEKFIALTCSRREATKRQAYLSFLSAANISAAMNGMYCWQYGGSTECPLFAQNMD